MLGMANSLNVAATAVILLHWLVGRMPARPARRALIAANAMFTKQSIL